MKNKILVLGYFGYNTNQFDGQTIKTRNVYELLKRNVTYHELEFFDTQEIHFNKRKILEMIIDICRCKYLFYIPAQNNLKYAFPLIFILSKLRNLSIYYILVGGWLADWLKNKPLHVFLLKQITRIYSETQLLRDRLNNEFAFSNVMLFPNFRITDFVPEFRPSMPLESLKIVFMSRINRMKGYDTIFHLAEVIANNKMNIIIDFFGPIFVNDQNDFEKKINQYDFVNYKGEIEPDKIYNTLSAYDILLLPTKYFTEGFPGAVLDAYISGIPVIVTKWLHAYEFVDDGVSGYIVPFENGSSSLVERIVVLYHNRNILYNLKQGAYEKSKQFTEEKVWNILKNDLLFGNQHY